ncbi:hypothetical protein [Salmonella enterica]|uniref:hypothetical protein n=1 Tax=Salmonella enterica TaxID=28901 RepID=UPI0030CFAA65
MIYKDITILYIDSGKNNRLIRYDLLRKENNDFVVQVFDDQNEDIADPKPTIKIDQFESLMIITLIIASIPISYRPHLKNMST